MKSSYSSDLVLLSIVIACVASYAALHLAAHVAATRRRLGWLVASAVAMGTGIWSMHFIAMLAYQLPVAVGYDVPLVVASLLIAIVASGIGLKVAGQPAPSATRIAFAGPVMGLAIAGMHYTGMASLRLPATHQYHAGLVITSVVIAVAASYAAIALFLHFRHDHTTRARWLRVVSAIVMGHAVSGMHYTAMAAVHFHHMPSAPQGLYMPPSRLAVFVAIATAVILLLIVGGAVIDRWIAATRSVRKSEERFRLMVDAIEDHAIFTVDAEGRVDTWNRGAERMFGYSAAEITGQSLCRLYPDSEKESAAQELRVAATEGVYEGEGERVAKNGEVRRVTITTAAMRDDRGDVLGFVRVLRDVTEKLQAEAELRRSEQQLRQAQKMEAVGQLAGGVAHDFNNMLTAIRGYAELLLMDHTDADIREPIIEIRKAADRSAALTRQLLAFSRKQVLQPRSLDPNTVVRDMESMLRRLLVGDVELVTRLESDAEIIVDPAQLEQVLLNLVVNARDAIVHGGRIEVETGNVDLDETFCATHPSSQPGPHVLLRVRDNGRGMSPEVLRHIFEPFFTTKTVGSGTGLGLSTVYGIIKQSDGHIWVESAEGKGAEFSIYFPRSSVMTAVPAVTVAGTHGRGSRETVLLVDDEPSVRALVRRFLERSGFDVLVANDGLHALQVSSAHAGDIDLLITDMMMPNMNGKDLRDQLARVRPGMSALFMSGYADDHIVERGLLDARMAFIQKPFEMEELMTKAREALERVA